MVASRPRESPGMAVEPMGFVPMCPVREDAGTVGMADGERIAKLAAGLRLTGAGPAELGGDVGFDDEESELVGWVPDGWLPVAFVPVVVVDPAGPAQPANMVTARRAIV